MLLAKAPARPEKAFAALDEHASGFDFAPNRFGSAFPATTQQPRYAGFNVVRFDPTTPKHEVFATNKTPGPASQSRGGRRVRAPGPPRRHPEGALPCAGYGGPLADHPSGGGPPLRRSYSSSTAPVSASMATLRRPSVNLNRP